MPAGSAPFVTLRASPSPFRRLRRGRHRIGESDRVDRPSARPGLDARV